MGVEASIRDKIQQVISPSHLEVINESHQHNVAPASETHFKVIAVSQQFEGCSLIDRHRKIYDALGSEFKGTLHALSLQLFSPLEWEQRSGASASPACLGGSKFDK